jgi:hypothetical protein
MTRVTKLTHKRLLELLDFDPAVGVFTWKVSTSNRVKVGSVAGVVHRPTGGRYIAVDGEKFMAHRLAWFYVKGDFSSKDVRPVDGNFDNLRFENLKEVERSELQHARGKNKNNTSGFQGVSVAPHNKWQAKITWKTKQVSLGMNFDSPEDASIVVTDAYSRLSGATDAIKTEAVFEALRIEKRQRAAWANLVGQGIIIGWASFEEFAAEVTDVPERRYAIAAIDSSRPIGPGNYRWASDGHPVADGVEGKRAYAKANYAANKDQLRDRDFRKKYGIDIVEYQRMLVDQKGVCAICEKPETRVENGVIRMLSVDHNHTTGAVRGLLCSGCNLAIGYACDDPEVLTKAATYLRRYQPQVIPFRDPKRDWLLVATPNFEGSYG